MSYECRRFNDTGIQWEAKSICTLSGRYKIRLARFRVCGGAALRAREGLAIVIVLVHYIIVIMSLYFGE